MDYASGPYTVTFPAGKTTATLNVQITDDMILEGDEKYMLTINGTSLPTGVTRGTPGEATVTIVDDDRKHKIIMQYIAPLLCNHINRMLE